MAVDGRVVIGVLAIPFIWGNFKSAYWSVQLRKLNDREVLSDRFSWLYKCMLDDEIEKTILAKNEKVQALIIGSSAAPA